jgi:hypothetical protein
MRARTFIAQACGLALVLGWAATASAHPGYPSVVDKWLGTNGIIEMSQPPKGCQLCHLSDVGGTPQLRPFGTLLVATYGLVKGTVEEDSSLANALDQLKSADPKLFMDMQRGTDPNSDPAVTAQAPPEAQYGCSAGGVPIPRGQPWLGGVLLLAPLRRALRKARPSPRQHSKASLCPTVY